MGPLWLHPSRTPYSGETSEGRCLTHPVHQAYHPHSSYQLRILSLGAGVQSTCIFLMACKGVLPKPHCAIFADTGWEMLATYQHLEWLEQIGKDNGIPIIRVSSGNLRESLVDGDSKHFASAPYFIKTPNGYSIGRRQCTREYKLEPIKRKTRELLGLKYRQRSPQGAVELWIGISIDELRRTRTYRPDRMSHVRFPLIEWVQMDRQQCIRWIAENYPGHVPQKSSCVGCPYRTDREWRALTDEEFRDACVVDEALRGSRFRNPAYMHRSCKPLVDVDLTDNQMRWFDSEAEKDSIMLTGLSGV